jgi:hypothetical protein
MLSTGTLNPFERCCRHGPHLHYDYWLTILTFRRVVRLSPVHRSAISCEISTLGNLPKYTFDVIFIGGPAVRLMRLTPDGGVVRP